MKHEFKVTKSKEQTVYTLESASSGGTSSGSVASVSTALGGVQRRPTDTIFAQEAKKDEAPKPRNFVAKNAKMGGAGKMKDKSKTIPRHEKHKKPVAEGPNDGKEDNFTIDDIKRLEKIRDLETLKAQAKELIKGKPARRMKPEKISWFYNHIDTLRNPLAVIKMMYDLMLAGEGNKVIGSRNSMSSNSYRTRFGEDHEIQMAGSELQSIAKNAVHLLDLVKKYSEQEGLQAWQQSKITKAADYLNSVLQSINGEQSGMEEARNNYHANTTGFSRGNRDDERHDLDVPRQSTSQQWALKINGQVDSNNIFTSRDQALQHRSSLLAKNPELEIGLVTKGGMAEGKRTMSRAAKGHEKYGKDGMKALAKAGREGASDEKLDAIRDKHDKYDESAKHGLYYNVNKRKKAGTSRDASSPKAPTAQAWKDAAKTAKKEGVAEGEVKQFPKKHRGDLSDTHECPKCGGDLEGGKYMGHAVKVCQPCRQVYLPPNSGIDQRGNKVDKQGVAESKERCQQCGMTNCSCAPGKCRCKPIAGWVPNKGFQKAVAEEWSKKYKSSINCSHPKGFSQKAHCAGKKKHDESIEMESVCPDCGMCETHGDNMMEVKQRLDAKCWKGKHKEGTKIKGGIRVNNCVPNESVAEDAYMMELAGQLAEKIPQGADVDYYIKDFAKSTAPQFKGKSPAKRKQMAIAAYYGSKQKKK